MPFSPSQSSIRNQLQRGFTLIEIMIVVAIIAILAAIAIPSYQDYVRRGQLQENFALLSGYQLRMEQTYQDNRSYAATGVSGCGTAIPASSRFTFSCQLTASGQGYTLTGAGTNGAVKGYTYTINQRGDRRTTLFKGQASTAACWLDKSPSC